MASLQDVSVPTSSHLYLYKVENSTFMAAAGILQGQPVTETSIIYGIESINPQNTDYFERYQHLPHMYATCLVYYGIIIPY